jgi:hypothetical protein
MKSLIRQKEEIDKNILMYLEEEVLNIKLSAEDMVECATNMRGQGYTTFLVSRERFIKNVDKLSSEIKNVISHNA